MRFVCEQCQTRYTIPDDKARGRALKVRCKKCDNVIIIKPVSTIAEPQASEPEAPAVEAGEATIVASSEDVARLREELRKSMAPAKARGAAPAAPTPASPPPAAAEDETEWFSIVNGQQEGPMTIAALVAKIAAGGVAARNYVWSEELPDWKRLEDVPALAVWLSDPTGSVALKPAATIKERSAPKGKTKAKTDRPQSGPDIQAMLDEVPIDDAGEGPGDIDPFADVPDSPDMVKPGAPGEMTRFVIAQSGIENRKSPWRIAIFLGGALVLIGGLVFALSQVGVNIIPGVHPHGKGNEKVFNGTASDDPSLRNALLGVHKEQTPARAPGSQVSHNAGPTPTPRDLGPLAHKEAQHVDQLDETKRQQLKNLYAKGGNDPSVKISAQSQAPAIDRPDAPLTARQVAGTVAHFQSGYGRCVDLELKRNPGFHGGKIRIVTTIMGSGLVRQAVIQSDDAALARRLTGSPLGGCLVDQTRRMVFPNFAGDPFDAEIPLVLGTAM